jgi:hypothetical protein
MLLLPAEDIKMTGFPIFHDTWAAAGKCHSVFLPNGVCLTSWRDSDGILGIQSRRHGCKEVPSKGFPRFLDRLLWGGTKEALIVSGLRGMRCRDSGGIEPGRLGEERIAGCSHVEP